VRAESKPSVHYFPILCTRLTLYQVYDTRIETSDRAAQVLPYQHLVTASLDCGDEAEILRLTFSTHDVEITGRNLRALLLAVQDFVVKSLRPIPQRYHGMMPGDNGVISTIRIEEAK
jgi:hypothetical protein